MNDEQHGNFKAEKLINLFIKIPNYAGILVFKNIRSPQVDIITKPSLSDPLNRWLDTALGLSRTLCN